MPQDSYKYLATVTLLAILLMALVTNLYAAEVRTQSPGKQVKQTPPKSPVAAQTVEQLNPIAKAAAEAGVVTCRSRINQITNFVAGNTKNGALLFAAPADPNKKQSSVSMEVMNQASNVPSYVTTNYSPSADGACSGSYEAVTYWQNSCQEVAKAVFSEFKPASRPLYQQIIVLGEGPSVRVFLLPAATGCIAIKKEILF